MSRWLKIANESYSYSTIVEEIKNTADVNKKKELIEKVKEHNDSYYLIANSIITKADKELYDDIINYIINGNESFHAGYLLIDKIIEKNDPLFNKVVEVAIKYPEYKKMIIEDGILTEDEVFDLELKSI